MKTSDFDYPLPDELIAQVPIDPRGSSRLLMLDRKIGSIIDSQFSELADQLRPGDLLVVNDTEVVPARIYGQKPSGGQVEVLLERILGQNRILAMTGSNKPLKKGQRINIDSASGWFEIVGRQAPFLLLDWNGKCEVIEVFEQHGHVPLPPYISREDNQLDKTRYQTVYACDPGAVAAPTAGLHFTHEFLHHLNLKGVKIATITLHVGAGTFQPVRVNDIDQHVMHHELVKVDQVVCDQIVASRARGDRVIAVGTTVVRALESMAACAKQGDRLEAYNGETNLFIRPGYQFKIIDGLVSNFHLPGSTLLMLVSAFAGTESTINAYHHAVAQRYRFFSYGDAMFIANLKNK